jgi:hypothetical protein
MTHTSFLTCGLPVRRVEGLTNLDVRLLAVASNALYAMGSSGIFKAID